MFSERFHLPIQITRHAALRMSERGMDNALLLDLLETGVIKHKDDLRLWVYKYYAERTDNLLCAAVVLETALVVKTVMHHFTPEA